MVEIIGGYSCYWGSVQRGECQVPAIHSTECGPHTFQISYIAYLQMKTLFIMTSPKLIPKQGIFLVQFEHTLNFLGMQLLCKTWNQFLFCFVQNVSKDCSSFWKITSPMANCRIWVLNYTHQYQVPACIYSCLTNGECKFRSKHLTTSFQDLYISKHIIFYYNLLSFYLSVESYGCFEIEVN